MCSSDLAIWYHMVVQFDDTQATNTNRVKVWVNGIQLSLTGSWPAQNTDYRVNNNAEHRIGRYMGSASNYFDGYLSEVNFIDGQALTPSSFGALNSDNIWVPKTYTGTYGTNGFYLPFSDNSALTSASNAGLGKDFSGNTNYWVTNGISITSGTSYDSMIDVPSDGASATQPSSNYCTMNPLNRAYSDITDRKSTRLNSSH